MATVPTTGGATVQPQQVAPTMQSDAGATPAAFGMPQAQAAIQGGQDLNDVSDRLAKAADTIASQNNAVARARDFSSFGAQAQSMVDNAVTTQDMSQPSVTQGLTQQLQDLAAKTAAAHADSNGPESAKYLQTMLQTQVGQYGVHIANIGSQVGQQHIQDTISGQMGPLTQAATMATTPLATLQAQAHAAVNNLAAPSAGGQPGMGPTQVAAMKLAVDQQLGDATVKGAAMRGDWAGVQTNLNDPQFPVTPGTREALNQNLIVYNAKQAEQNTKVNAMVSTMKGLGVDVDPAMIKTALGLNTEADTGSALIAAYEAHTGQQAPPAFVAAAYKLGTPVNPNLGFTTSRALPQLTAQIASYADNTMPADQQKVFRTQLALISTPHQEHDAVTGIPYMVPGLVSPDLAQGVAAHDRLMGNGYSSYPVQPSNTGQPNYLMPPGGNTSAPGYGAPPVPPPQGVPAPQPAQLSPASQPAGNNPSAAPAYTPASADHPADTWFQAAAAGTTTGLIPAVVRAARESPFGSLVNGSAPVQQATTAAVLNTQLQQILTNLAPGDARMGGGAVANSIMKDYNLDPQTFGNTDAYLDNLVGLDHALGIIQQGVASRALGTTGQSAASVQEARTLLSQIQYFRSELNIPYGTATDYKNAPPGGRVVRIMEDGTGKIYHKPLTGN